MTDQFSSQFPNVLYLDINSCFATLEQQAHPKLRGKPVVVAAYETGNGCILAASTQAKVLGIKTGMLVREAQKICPNIYITTPDPEKYRYINKQLHTLLLEYSPHVQVQSIDEMIVRMQGTPYLASCRTADEICIYMKKLGMEIKERIYREIGDQITVSIGVAPNAFLAKTASNLKKPNGLETITKNNIRSVLSSLVLTDLCGIKHGNASRLLLHGIATPIAMYDATIETLECAFHSIIGKHWWMWLHGWEIGSIYEEKKKRKSYSQSCSLSCHTSPMDRQTIQVTYQLVSKMAARLRDDGCRATGIMAGCSYSDRSYWRKTEKLQTSLYATEDIFSFVKDMFTCAPEKPIHTVFVGVYDVVSDLYSQLTLDEKELQKQARTKAIDAINHRFGNEMITGAVSLEPKQKILDRIAFGKNSL